MHSSPRTLLVSGCAAVMAVGCGHSRAAQPAVSSPPPAQQTPAAVVPSPQPEAATPIPEQRPTESAKGEPISAFMLDHFVIVVSARDAVIDGDIDSVRKPLRALADYAYESVIPGGWMRDVAQLQAAARLTSQAEDLAVAASGVAAMTRICGECHKAQGHGLPLEPVEVTTKTPKSDSLAQRMGRHAWASERLWEGLMAPSGEAWRAGAAALAHAPVRAPKQGAEHAEDFAHSLTELRELGLRATYAESASERADVYGLVLATCAKCHSQLATASY